MKIVFGAAFAVFALIALSGSAEAQSNDEILKRLNLLEKENAGLRQRVQRLESGKLRVASARTDTSASTAAPTPLFASPAMLAQASANPRMDGIKNSMPSSTWNGFYIGAHGGYAFSNMLPPSGGTGLATNIGLHGRFGGIQAGYNIQLAPHWLIGVEQDISIGRVSGTQTQRFPNPTITVKSDAFGTMRGRFGYIWNDILFYETAGIAWSYNSAKLDYSTVAQATAAFADAVGFSQSHMQWGVVAGGGVEFPVNPNLTLKAEFQYLYLTKEQYFSGTSDAAVAGWPLMTARVGANWHFN